MDAWVRVGFGVVVGRRAMGAVTVRLLWLVLLGLTGCLRAASETCANGSVCPTGFLCVDTQHTTTGSQICAAGTCGNGVLDPGEACDDGNNRAGDGCPADCTKPCGDGVLDPGEVCDDGNNLDGDGCAADCQTLDHRFDVSPAAVNLTAIEGDALPDPTTVSVRLELAGDSLLVGYPPGVAAPSWLSITEGAPSDNVIELALRPIDTLSVGERSTSVRLTLGHVNSTSVESLDLPVTYTVQPSDLAIAASPASLAFTAVAGDVFVPPQTITLTLNGDPATVVSAPPWLTVTRTSQATFTATVTDTLAGPTLSDTIVFATTRALLQRTVDVHVDCQIHDPPALALSAAPTTLTLRAVTGGLPPAPAAVAITFTGAIVKLASPPPPWLTVTPPPPTVTSPASFTLAANTTAMPAGTVSTADLVFSTVRGSDQQDATVHVEYDVLAEPVIRYVAPYVGSAGRGGSLFIRGHGFQNGAPVTVAIGALQIGAITPDNDTQITVPYPPLPAGRYPVTMVDPPGVAPNAPALVIVDPPAFTYQLIHGVGWWARLVFDAERQVLYAVDPITQQIGRFVYANGAWSALPPTIVAGLADLAMTPDGGALMVVRDLELDEISLRDDLFTPVERASFPQGTSCTRFTGMAIPNHGNAFVRTGDSSSDFGCLLYRYDLLDHTLVLYQGRNESRLTEASGDGSTLFLENIGEVGIYDARSDTASIFDRFFFDEPRNLSVSCDGSRALVDDSVIDHAGILGTIPSLATPFISRDGTRAFVYEENAPGARIDIYDLTAPITPFPVVRTIALPDPVGGVLSTAVLTTNLDDTVVFVAGGAGILVVPVTP